MKMTTDIPPAITTPDSVETSLGTLTFVDGLPDQDTVQKVYDNLDRMPGIEVFLNTLAPASLLANTEWLKSVGWDNYSAVIHEDCVDAGPRTGANYHPHLTVGIGTRDFVDALKAEPFQPFTVRADSVSLYQLGDYGTAARKLDELHRC